MAHNFYQRPGGEDEVFRNEASMLEAHGYDLLRYTKDNKTIPELGTISAATGTLWSRVVYRELSHLLRSEAPRVIHFHNTFPLISPAAYYAAVRAGVPVVQTLHNYRLICPGGLLLRESRPCELCVGKAVALPGIVHACYRQSRSATAVTAAMLTLQHTLGTWTKAVGAFVALTEFSRRKYIEGGLPQERILVKPNFLRIDPGAGPHDGGFALFVGRLVGEKGVLTLVKAWHQLGDTIPLKVVGEGPLSGLSTDGPRGVEWLGQLPKDGVTALMKAAAFLVFPSEWYEGFPMTLLEAFATGLPVIVSGHGAMAEIVSDGATGRQFRPGDVLDLVSTVRWAWEHPEEMAVMGRRARIEFETKYTADRNFELLMQVYDQACNTASGT